MVKLHTKIAVPFASLIIILIGVPLSAKKKRGGLATEIGISLFAGFLFLGLQKTIATFGYNGVVNPMLAAWLPNLLFLAIGTASTVTPPTEPLRPTPVTLQKATTEAASA